MPDRQTLRDLTDPVISIGLLAERVGLSVSAIRKYEREGLIIAHRTASGRRLFSHEDISRVRNIQHMIQDLGLNIEGIRRMQAMAPCWDLLSCDAETCRTCPAYADNQKPCWMMKGAGCSPQCDDCRRCVVYRFVSMCTPDIKRVLQYKDGAGDGRTPAGQDLMELYLQDAAVARAGEADGPDGSGSDGEPA